MAGARVADVARLHGVTRWQVYDWRKKLKAGVLALPAETAKEPMFAALVVEPKTARPSRHPKKRSVTTRLCKIELVVEGVTLRVSYRFHFEMTLFIHGWPDRDLMRSASSATAFHA